MSEDNTIRSPEQFERMMKARREKARNRIANFDKIDQDKSKHVQHADVANQVLKVVYSLDMHPRIKQVLTLRIMGPINTGREATHLSIAISLGLKEGEVKEMETEGLYQLHEALKAVSSKEFVERFNKSKKVEEAVKEIKGQTLSGSPKQNGVNDEDNRGKLII